MFELVSTVKNNAPPELLSSLFFCIYHVYVFKNDCNCSDSSFIELYELWWLRKMKRHEKNVSGMQNA